MTPASRPAPRPFALIGAELIKLRRSPAWLLAALIPAAAVLTGAINYSGNSGPGGSLDPTWEDYTSQVTLFYGLVFATLTVSLIAASVWRPEHRTTSWNLVASSGHPRWALVTAKTLVIAMPLALAQTVFTVLTWICGTFVFDVEGTMPPAFVSANAIALVAALPLIALQSAVASRLPAFIASPAVGLVGAVIGIGVLGKGALIVRVWPPSLLTQALTLGSSALSDAGTLDWAGVAPVLAGTAVSAVACWGALALVGGPRRV
ncbi:ABC transporter permease [Actinomyces sp. B33]|uniref:ABC transporter permease n=1 Tax=Actinomyces sp. B33 TaxID=2942131 RepID=UPI00234250DD|nr:ABC transporter permease [Actinomyces sp. B33]MDC4232698.1 ABC transporter permease [Actinomyces sp. B33]